MSTIEIKDLKRIIDQIEGRYECQHKPGMSYDDFLSAKSGFEILMREIKKQNA